MVRNVCAGALVVLYGLACGLAYLGNDAAFRVFVVASLISVPFIAWQLIVRMLTGLLISAVLGALVAAFPVDSLVAAAIVVFTAIWAVIRLVSKMSRFVKRLPFLISSAGLYGFLAGIPSLVAHSFVVSGDVRFFVAFAVGMVGIALLLLMAGVAWWLGVQFPAAIFFTAGVGWYIAVFFVTFIPSLFGDGDDDEGEDDDSERF